MPKEWLNDKNSKEYKRYIERRRKSMIEAHWKRLDALNKLPPSEHSKVEENPILKKYGKRTKK